MATITICDLCGTRNGVERKSYIYDRKTDPAGNMEDKVEVYDLCPKCECKILNSVIHKRTNKSDILSLNTDIINNIIRRKKENAIHDIS